MSTKNSSPNLHELVDSVLESLAAKQPVATPKKPVSEKRLAANRANAQRSTGPRTASGKQRASQNATRHGLLAKMTVLQTESEADFEQTLDEHYRHFLPANEIEMGFVQQIAAAHWRLLRLRTLETNFFDRAILRSAGDGDFNAPLEGFTRLGDRGTLDLLMRYEAHLSRIQHRALRNLRAEQKNRPPARSHSEDAPQNCETNPTAPASEPRLQSEPHCERHSEHHWEQKDQAEIDRMPSPGRVSQVPMKPDSQHR